MKTSLTAVLSAVIWVTSSLFSTSHAQIISEDFSTDPLAAYTNGSGGRFALTHNALDGNLTVTPVTSAAAHNTTLGTFDSVGGALTLSVDFFTSSHSDAGNFNAAFVGLSTVAADFYGTFSGFEVTSRQAGTAGEYFLRLRMGDNSTGQLTSTNAALAASTWHRLTLNVASTGTAQEYIVFASLATQADPSTFLASIGDTTITRVAANGLLDNATNNLFAGFGGATNGGTGGALALDNYLVAIPEPSTVFLMGGALMGLALLRRNRR